MRPMLAALALVAACSDPVPPVAPDAAPPYSLTWTCQSVCSPPPDLTKTTTLAIGARSLTYGGGPGGESHAATMDDAGCLNVDAAFVPAGGQRNAYQICPVANGYDGVIVWVSPGHVSTWRLQAWR